jgi:hypothetical protein
MRNRVSFLKQYPARTGVSRRSRRAAGLALAAVLALGWGRAAGQEPTPADAIRLPGQPSPALARLFIPRAAPPGVYRVQVVGVGIDQAAREVERTLPGGAAPGRGHGAWRVHPAAPEEAFGDAGDYDQSRLARLFGGKRPSVCRGPVEQDGRVIASVFLVSPYPDPTLTRLEPGTMIIVFDPGKGTRQGRPPEGR